VKGTVRKRPDSMVNRDMPTGGIEVAASEIVVLSPCEVLPFMIDERSDAKDDLKLKYRFLDLRSFAMQRNIRIRDEVAFRVREFLRSEGFYEIETPTLIRSTPEGARDFLVPPASMPENSTPSLRARSSSSRSSWSPASTSISRSPAATVTRMPAATVSSSSLKSTSK
jgi:aspartyl-tRNA synthetase